MQAGCRREDAGAAGPPRLAAHVADDAPGFGDEERTGGNSGQNRLVLPEDIELTTGDEEQ